MMKVLMLSDFYPPIIGGMERHVSLLSRELAQRDHEVIVCTIGNKHLPEVQISGKVKIIRCEGFFQKIPFLYNDPKRKYPSPIQDLLITRKLKNIIVKERPDVIHAHGWILYSVLSLKKKIRIPLIVTLHDYGSICPKKTLMNAREICDRAFTNKCINCAKESYSLIKSFFTYYSVKSNKDKLKVVDKFIAVSHFVKQVHSRHLGLKPEDIVVIPNFYERNRGKPDLEDTEILPKDFVLFVGALAPYKGVDILIEAYKKIDTKTKLVLVGTKQPNHHYETTKNIIIVENALNNVVKEAYSRCRFVVIPSVWPEPFGLVALEAMALKKTIIASDIGGLNEIIQNNKTGLLVPSNNPRELAKAIRYLLRRPPLTHEMGVKGYHRLIGNFSREKILPQVESVYEEVISFNEEGYRGHRYLKPR